MSLFTYILLFSQFTYILAQDSSSSSSTAGTLIDLLSSSGITVIPVSESNTIDLVLIIIIIIFAFISLLLIRKIYQLYREQHDNAVYPMEESDETTKKNWKIEYTVNED
jgi:hypothetical protein